MKERIELVWFNDNRIYIQTNLGETLSQPLEVFPALFLASEEQRERYKIWGENQSIRWEELDEDIHVSDFRESETVNYDNEVNRLLSIFPFLDMKAFARHIGMHWTKLARFRYGVWTPSPEAIDKIRNGVEYIKKELSAAAVL